MSRKSRQGYSIRHLLQLPNARSPPSTPPHPPAPCIKAHLTCYSLLSAKRIISEQDSGYRDKAFEGPIRRDSHALRAFIGKYPRGNNNKY
ncbi:unnamed protein product, partial [Iphiclides podalirius]